MFIRCLQIMYKVDKAFTRFESQNKTGKFAEGKDLLKVNLQELDSWLL